MTTTPDTNHYSKSEALADSDSVSTRVTFCRFVDENDVLAILWDVPARPPWVMMYQHIGQHGEGTPDLLSDIGVVPADITEKDTAALKAELESIGYVLTVVTGNPRHYPK